MDWYDQNDWVRINSEEKQLKTLLFTKNGKEYSISLGDVLRGGLRKESYFRNINIGLIKWSDPRIDNGITEEQWKKVQSLQPWIGMTENQLMLVKILLPDNVNESHSSTGITKQYVFRGVDGTEYYYFKNGELISWDSQE